LEPKIIITGAHLKAENWSVLVLRGNGSNVKRLYILKRRRRNNEKRNVTRREAITIALCECFLAVLPSIGYLALDDRS